MMRDCIVSGEHTYLEGLVEEGWLAPAVPSARQRPALPAYSPVMSRNSQVGKRSSDGHVRGDCTNRAPHPGRNLTKPDETIGIRPSKVVHHPSTLHACAFLAPRAVHPIYTVTASSRVGTYLDFTCANPRPAIHLINCVGNMHRTTQTTAGLPKAPFKQTS